MTMYKAITGLDSLWNIGVLITITNFCLWLHSCKNTWILVWWVSILDQPTEIYQEMKAKLTLKKIQGPSSFYYQRPICLFLPWSTFCNLGINVWCHYYLATYWKWPLKFISMPHMKENIIWTFQLASSQFCSFLMITESWGWRSCRNPISLAS